MKSNTTLFTIAITLIMLTACKKDKDPVKNPPPVTNGQELITSMLLSFTDSSGLSTAKVFGFKDQDGPGGNPPSLYDTIKLESGKTYFVTLLLLNESKTPVDTISNEVYEERNDHQVFYKHTGLNLQTWYLDKDTKGLPLGLSTKWTSGATGKGSTKVTLKHQPGVKDGSEAPGDTDAEVTFQVVIN
jgi:hypothetical protein